MGDALTQNTGDCGVLAIAAEDAAGNAFSPTGAVTVNLSSSSTTGAFYADSACSAALTCLRGRPIVAGWAAGSVRSSSSALQKVSPPFN